MSNGKAVFGMLLCLAASTVCVSGQTLPPELQAKQNFGLQREPQLVSRWIEDLMEPVSANHIRSSRQTPDIPSYFVTLLNQGAKLNIFY